ncbi:MBL fold metallo-hydrolase [Bacillus marasmi]|uniref:MBL fold metallo-hydrolase n=1 Tax=Bacillus marasmi TaxID=1926279 RepID=UPI0011C80BF0|nr:MBL fold metallo-hydrolase [Bacillus marasmi]
MLFRSFFDENLAHMSYLIGCQRTGDSIVIDPARNIEVYIKEAEKEGLNITAATETHIHADFVSGCKQLARTVGAKLYLSDEGDENWKYQYLNEVKYELVKEGSSFMVGNVKFDVIHTPGHTPESISFILTDIGGGATKPMGIFSGDFVFVGDIGRPDLLEKAAGVEGTAEPGARQMFQSLKKFKQLPDYLQVWPAHGAGSACGKALGAVPVSTVGYEKMNNWALRINNEDEFVKVLLSGQPEPPLYFAMMKKLNKIGPAYLPTREIPFINSLETLEKLSQPSTVIIDTRPAKEFAQGHLPGTINIPYNKSFTNWAGWFVTYEQDIVLIAEETNLVQMKQALTSIGLDRIIGVVNPLLVTSSHELESYSEIDVYQLEDYLSNDQYCLIDVRGQSEWEEGRLPNAIHIMLGTLPKRLDEIPSGKTCILQCRSGARSAIAASLLQAYGIKKVVNLKGGYLDWAKEKLPIIKA